MDDHREELNDIDRAIAQALDVDVRPDFAARVRERIAAEPKPRPFWTGWRIAVPAFAAAALIVTTSVTILLPQRESTPPLAAHAVPVRPLPPAAGRPSHAVVVRPDPARVDRVRVRVASVRATAPSEPEVLVPREEIEMYRRLLAAARSAPPEFAVIAAEEPAAIPLFPEITIDPIKIDPIVPPVGGEGERQ